MTITCCNGCVPPKRTPTCHATYPEYTQQKAKHEAERERINKAKRTQAEITGQVGEAVRRANRRKKL